MAQQRWFQTARAGCLGGLGGVLLAATPTVAMAQVAGDGTLGTQVNGALTTPCSGTCIITDGTTRGNNLFHSFQQFSLPDGDFAGFVTTPAIQNVMVRVTGVGQPFISNLNGTIATVNAAGNATNPTNFFLLNPNGIIFGPGATLNIGGSFLATTADRMQFADGTEFRTDAPAPLLTVSVPIGLQFGGAPGNIQMQRTRLSAGNTDSFSDFALVGGDITLDQSIVFAPGQRVELGGVATGKVGLSINGNNLSLIFPADSTRADIAIANNSSLDIVAGGGGGIAINARNLEISSGSTLQSGIGSGLGTETSRSGDITLNATDQIKVDRSQVKNIVFLNGVGTSGDVRITAKSLYLSNRTEIGTTLFGKGKAGDVSIDTQQTISVDKSSGIYSDIVGRSAIGDGGSIVINTGSLSLLNGAEISSTSFGKGNGGNITINSQVVSIDGIDQDGFISQITDGIGPEAVGSSGNITVSTDSLSITNGGRILASLSGEGRPGNITINARNDVSIDGFALYKLPDQYFILNRSGIFTNVIGKVIDTIGADRRGSIVINTNSLQLSNDGGLSTATFGDGNAGDITINAANQVSLTGGTFTDGIISSGVDENARGQGGNIRITTGSLLATNRAELTASTAGQGDAGNIIIDARDLVSFENSSGAFSAVTLSGRGKGGDIYVTARSLSFTSGGELSASTLGQGKAGNIFVTARDAIALDGTGDDGFSSGLFAFTERGATGAGGNIITESLAFQIANGATVNARTSSASTGGNITIKTDNFEAVNGGQVITTTRGDGQAGDINLAVANQITLSGSDSTYGDRLIQFGKDTIDNEGSASGLFANTSPGSSGNGGSIVISPRTVTIQDGAKIAVDSQGSGTGGNIIINAHSLDLDNGQIIAESAASEGGDIFIGAKPNGVPFADLTVTSPDTILLRHNSLISATAGNNQNPGNGGNITINSPFVIGFPDENSDIIANAFSGTGGNIAINAAAILNFQLNDEANLDRLRSNTTNDISASSQFGGDGTLNLTGLGVDPTQGITQLPTNPSSPQPSQGCQVTSTTGQSTQAEFFTTGRGGISSSPSDPLGSNSILDDLRIPPELVTVQTAPTLASDPSLLTEEATHWQINTQGNIILTAQSSTRPKTSRCKLLSR